MSDLKTEALLACAEAYRRRGPWVQYDQLSMDRVVRVTPRRRIFLPPEAATEQDPLFLDCSGFIHAVYYSAFGYELPAKLTWNMIEQVEPRLFCHELTHEETPEEIEEMTRTLRALLRPGDVVTYEYEGGGNGHTMLVVSGTEFMHCTGHDRPGGYDYELLREDVLPDGAIRTDPLESYFEPEGGAGRYWLFSKRFRRVAVCRPLEAVGEPTPAALARLALGLDLRFSVLSSHPGGRQAEAGGTVTLTVRTDNTGDEPRTVTLHFNACAQAETLAEETASLTVPARETACARFAFRVPSGCSGPAAEVRVWADGLPLYAPPVLLRKASLPADARKLADDFTEALRRGKDCFDALSEACGKQSLPLRVRRHDWAARYFFPYDSLPSDVLYRRPARPGDGSVPGLFGGFGVITPEMGPGGGMRCTTVGRRDLEPGDVLICSDDPYASRAYACVYTGETLAGCPEAGAEPRIFTDTETDRFLELLFGRFSFLVLRPRQLP